MDAEQKEIAGHDAGPQQLPPPTIEEIEAEWAVLHCECYGDFFAEPL